MKKILIITTITLLVLAVTLAALWYTHSTPEDLNYCHSLFTLHSGESGICLLHGLPLQEDTVPILYGLLAPSYWEAYEKACEQEFPHANSFIAGGCVVESVKEDKVFFCSLCRQAEKAWYKKYMSENKLKMELIPND